MLILEFSKYFANMGWVELTHGFWGDIVKLCEEVNASHLLDNEGNVLHAR